MGGRILVIDDEPEMGDLLAEGLGRRGFQVTASTSPAADTITAPKGRLPRRRAACDQTMALRK